MCEVSQHDQLVMMALLPLYAASSPLQWWCSRRGRQQPGCQVATARRPQACCSMTAIDLAWLALLKAMHLKDALLHARRVPGNHLRAP